MMKNNILIVGPAWVGDMVMAQCLFKTLKFFYPEKKLDVLAPAWTFPLLARMPEVSQAIISPFHHGELALKKRYQLAKQLRTGHYKEAIVLPNSFKSALIPFFARIPIRTGFKGEMRYLLLNDLRPLDKKKYPLMVERFMALGLPKGHSLPKDIVPHLQVSLDSQKVTLAKHNILLSKKPILVLCPGAEFGSAKRWPAEHYAFLANAKIKEGWEVWLLGSEKDVPFTKEILSHAEGELVNFVGKTTLEEAIDLLSFASLVVSNDSGLMHVASALNKPLVALYGPTSATFTPPLNAKSKVLSLQLPCQPCFARECPLEHHQCMKGLYPNVVLNAMNTVCAS